MTALITVVITSYNRPNLLQKSISAVLKQTYKNMKILVLDDCSTIDVSSIIESFHDDRLTFIRNPVNLGLTGNWLKAINLCDTKYFSLTHDDDYMEPTLIERQLNIMENDSDIGMVSSSGRIIDETGNYLWDHEIDRDTIFNKNEYVNFIIDKKHVYKNIILCPSVMMRTDVIKKINYNFFSYVGYPSDLYWYLKINEIAGIYILSEKLFNYRLHKKQLSNDDLIMTKELLTNVVPLIEEHVGAGKCIELKDYFRARIYILEQYNLLKNLVVSENLYHILEIKQRYFVNQLSDFNVSFLNSTLVIVNFLKVQFGHKNIDYYIWGASESGIKTKKILDKALPNFHLEGFIDKYKKGYVEGYRIFPPDEVKFDKCKYIFICSTLGAASIINLFEEKNYKIFNDYVFGYGFINELEEDIEWSN